MAPIVIETTDEAQRLLRPSWLIYGAILQEVRLKLKEEGTTGRSGRLSFHTVARGGVRWRGLLRKPQLSNVVN